MKQKIVSLTLASMILVMLLCVSVSAGDWFEFDNYKTFDKDVGDYGKITILDKNLFGEDDPLQEIELKINTEVCEDNKCKATIEIIMHEPGVLITDFSFFDLKENKTITIRGHNFYIVDGKERTLYNLGDEVEAGTYEVELDGKIKPFQKGDWKIKVGNNFWINEYAIWESSLDVDLIAYWDFDATTGSVLEDIITGDYNGTLKNMENGDWVAGKIGNALDFDGTDEYVEEIGRITALEGDNANWTISYWAKSDEEGSDRIVFGYGADDTFSAAGDIGVWQGNVKTNVYVGGTAEADLGDLGWDDGDWHNMVLAKNNSHLEVWLDGSLIKTQNGTSMSVCSGCKFNISEDYNLNHYDGMLDEMVIWNKTLTNSEINTLWNSGDGISYGDVGIKLISPSDDSFSFDDPMVFSINATPFTGSELNNATIYVWDNLGVIVNQTTKKISGSVENTTNFSISNLPPGILKWNVFVCHNDSSSATCNFTENNFTLNYGLIINSQTFNNLTTEGNLENYLANLTLKSGLTISKSLFIYNGTPEIAENFISGSNFILRKSNLLIPGIVTQTDVSFNWKITLSDSSSINLTTNTQTILPLGIDNCSSFTNQIFNFTTIDEEHQNVLNNNTIELAVNIYSLDRSSLILNFSSIFNNTNPASVCINGTLLNNSRYSLDAVVRYSSPAHEIEYYNMENFTLTNDTGIKNIFLFDLLTADSTEFRLTFTGVDFLPEEDVLVFVERQYIAENNFKTVELPKTDTNGQTILHLVRNDIVYNLIFVKNNIVLKNFRNLRAFCQDPTLSECSISLNALSDEEALPIYDNELGIAYDGPPTYNENTTTISFTYISVDGEIKNVTMNVERNDIFGNISVCSNYLISASGTIFCNIGSGITDTTLITTIIVDGNTKIISQVIIDDSAYGSFGYVFWFFLALGLVLTFSKDKNGILIALLISYIGSVGLGFILGGVIGVGSAGIWIIIITMVGLWRLNKNKPD